MNPRFILIPLLCGSVIAILASRTHLFNVDTPPSNNPTNQHQSPPRLQNNFGKLTKADILKLSPKVQPSSSSVQVNLDPSCTLAKTINEGHWFLGATDKEQFERISELLSEYHLQDIRDIVYDLDHEQVLILTTPSLRNYAKIQRRLEGFDIPISIRPACRSLEQGLKLLKSVRAFIKRHDHLHELMSTGLEPTNSSANIWLKDFSYGLKQTIEKAYGDLVIVRFFDPVRDEL